MTYEEMYTELFTETKEYYVIRTTDNQGTTVELVDMDYIGDELAPF